MRNSLFTVILFLSGFASAQSFDDLNSSLADSAIVTVDSSLNQRVKPMEPEFYGLEEIKSDKIDLLIQDYKDQKKVFGYRIQIFSSSTRAEAMKARIDFMNSNPQIKSYLVYQAPNFKVRVGDFYDRLMVHKELKKIHESFPTAFIVKGEIEPVID